MNSVLAIVYELKHIYIEYKDCAYLFNVGGSKLLASAFVFYMPSIKMITAFTMIMTIDLCRKYDQLFFF